MATRTFIRVALDGTYVDLINAQIHPAGWVKGQRRENPDAPVVAFPNHRIHQLTWHREEVA